MFILLNLGCPSDVIKLLATDQKRHFTSPLFPNFSPSYPKHCSWLITAPRDHVIVLRFLRFEIQFNNFCENDHITVRDGAKSNSTILEKLCGIDQKCPITSSGRYMLIQYRTDKHGIRNAFKASYVALKQGTHT